MSALLTRLRALNGPKKAGSRPNIRRLRYVERYQLSDKQRSALSLQMIDQLDACKTEACRRILLGVSK